MATTESAGRPPLARTTSTQSAKSATSVRSSHSQSSQQVSRFPQICQSYFKIVHWLYFIKLLQSKSKSSTEQYPKSQPTSPKSSKSSAEKQEHEQAETPSVSASKTAANFQKKLIIDMSIFSQILELDDDETREFSRSMVNDYYSQVDATLIKMDDALYVSVPLQGVLNLILLQQV
jgi:hypothetical protein